ncbi:MAG: hypothetical protein JXR51_01075 [Bacteroidales bacterium]|nr:hypothetical protein [Bacteroidales bacterium]
MQKSFYFILIFSISLFSCNNDDENQDNNNSSELIADSNQSSIQNTAFEQQNYEIPKELVYNKQKGDFLYDKFYPIGWSREGKFAYIIENADEGSGYYWFEIIVKDIVNSKIVWSWKPEESEEGDLKSTWESNYKLFAEKLNNSEIIQIKQFELKPTKSTFKGNDYKFKIETATVADQDYGFEVIKEITINISSPELGNKEIYNIKNESGSMTLGAILSGYLQSPDDDRIIVILKQERFGYEGPPNVISFELINSDLSRGFKKDEDS